MNASTATKPIGNYTQDEKPCLSIGRYGTENESVCSPRKWITEKVNDYKEHQSKSRQFDADHKGKRPIFEFISANESVIIYEYKKYSFAKTN